LVAIYAPSTAGEDRVEPARPARSTMVSVAYEEGDEEEAWSQIKKTIAAGDYTGGITDGMKVERVDGGMLMVVWVAE
jgi:GH24 family phage-related lysozyme (muramidase)